MSKEKSGLEFIFIDADTGELKTVSFKEKEKMVFSDHEKTEEVNKEMENILRLIKSGENEEDISANMIKAFDSIKEKLFPTPEKIDKESFQKGQDDEEQADKHCPFCRFQGGESLLSPLYTYMPVTPQTPIGFAKSEVAAKKSRQMTAFFGYYGCASYIFPLQQVEAGEHVALLFQSDPEISELNDIDYFFGNKRIVSFVFQQTKNGYTREVYDPSPVNCRKNQRTCTGVLLEETKEHLLPLDLCAKAKGLFTPPKDLFMTSEEE